MTERSYHGREALLRAVERKTSEGYLPDRGTWVRFRALTEGERIAYDSECDQTKYADYHARAIAKTAVDQAGTRLFSDEDIATIQTQWSAADVAVAWATLAPLSALRVADVQALLGNFVNDRNGASSSGS